MMSEKKFNEAITNLQRGKFKEGIKILEKLNRKIPNNADVLYNLGTAHSELGELKSAEKYLKKCISMNPDYSNAYIALGMVFFKRGEVKSAEQYFDRALIIEPDNPYANKNLGSLFGKAGDNEKAIEYFTKALNYLPDDVQLHYGIGLACLNQSDTQKARKHFKKVIDTAPNSSISELAKQEINKLSQQDNRVPKEQIVNYCLKALKLFDKTGIEITKNIVTEIAILGKTGLDYTNKYSIDSLEGEYTGLELVAYMYVGLQEIAPDKDAGVDFSIEYHKALNQYDG